MNMSASANSSTSEGASFGVVINGKNVVVRPIQRSDTAMEALFVRDLSPETRRLRFFGGVQELSPSELKMFCEVDGHRSMAFIATVAEGGRERAVGVSRYAPSQQPDASEMALTVADDWQHTELGEILLRHLFAYARTQGIRRLYSVELADNHQMHQLARKLGMTAATEMDDSTEVTYSIAL